MARSNPYGTEAGLPTAEDYDPDAIGGAELSAGEPEQTWDEFGLELVPVLHDGEDTGRRLVRRNGNFIADVTERYKILPNERAVAAANEVAQELGAEPFHEFDGDWFIELDDHVFQDPEGRRVHAVYAWESGTVAGDDMEYGFAIHNSIDGSMGFRVGLFSFRHACANMVMMGAGNAQEQGALGVEDERSILNSSMRKHTSGMDVDTDALKARIESTLFLVEDIHDGYRDLVDRALTPEEVAGLLDRLPQKNLPAWFSDLAEDLREAQENESLEGEGWTRDRKKSLIEGHIPTEETAWETYNDITESLWHDDSSSDQTKQRKMRQLHRAVNVADDIK